MPLLKKLQTGGSQLTPLNGNQPGAPLSDAATIPVNNTFSRGTYVDYVSETPRAVDTTGNVQ
jgi:hypothetical protein|tara:strand:- start:321 stop:506 length:186 start_codon:yes stop_codon:yes gene_type:complete